MIPDLRNRLIAVRRFALVHFLVGVVAVAGLVIVFRIGIVEPGTHWMVAQYSLTGGLVLALADTMRFGIGFVVRRDRTT